MLQGFLLVVLVLVCIALGTVILLQRSEGGAFGMGGGPSGLLTARGAGDLLTRITSILAAIFFGLCLLLTILSGRNHGESVVDRLKVDALNPDALNRSMRPAAAPVAPSGGVTSSAPAPLAPAPLASAPLAPGAAAPAAGIAAGRPAVAAAKPSFDAPRPQVHTAAAPGGGSAPAVTTDSGARSRVTNLLGYQTAPQAQPTVAPHPASAAAAPPVQSTQTPAAPPAPARAAPATSAAGASSAPGNTGQ